MLPRHSVGVEIGVWRGDFSAQILEAVMPRQLHLIDPWAFRPDYPGAWYGGARAASQADMDAIYNGVAARFAGDERVRIHRCHSASAQLPALDWAYIDGDHTYEAVKADVELCMGLVRPGGLICGDDYGRGSEAWWEGGVTRAVDELARRPLVLGGGQFAVVR